MKMALLTMLTLEDAIGRYIAKVDPKGEFTRKRTQQDELAKEGRKEEKRQSRQKNVQQKRQKKQMSATYQQAYSIQKT